jgi:hypothetical protein
MGHEDHITAKRERDFQNKLLEALQALRPPKRTILGRILKVANSSLFLVLVGLIVSFLVFYRQTYVQCVSNSRKLFADYIGMKMELLHRENEILEVVIKANSIADLRERIDQKKSFDSRYKDNTITDLRTQYAQASEFIDESGIDASAETTLRSLELYQKYNQIFIAGIVPSTLTDSDLAPLKLLAVSAGEVEMINFITDIRSTADIQCIWPNVLLIMWGETPVTIQRYDVGSFSGKELLSIQISKGRNLLTPRVAPAPFPQTNFQPPASVTLPPAK